MKFSMTIHPLCVFSTGLLCLLFPTFLPALDAQESAAQLAVPLPSSATVLIRDQSVVALDMRGQTITRGNTTDDTACVIQAAIDKQLAWQRSAGSMERKLQVGIVSETLVLRYREGGLSDGKPTASRGETMK